MAEDAAAIAAELAKKGLPTADGTEDDDGDAQDGEELVEVVESEDEVESQSGTTQDSTTPDEDAIAQGSGWKPKDKWEGDPAEWIPAREFNRRGELLRKIHNQNRQIKQLDGVVNTLANQQKKIFDAGYDKAKRDLRSQLREATKEGDDVAADAIEQRLEQLEQQKAQDVAPLQAATRQAAPEIAPEFVTWVGNNKWFMERPEMRVFAEAVGVSHAQANPHLTNSEIYQYVSNEVKRRFPERFGTVMKKQSTKLSSPVVGSDDLISGQGRASGSTVHKVALTTEEKHVGRTLVEKGVYKNLNEYAQHLKNLGVKG